MAALSRASAWIAAPTVQDLDCSGCGLHVFDYIHDDYVCALTGQSAGER